MATHNLTVRDRGLRAARSGAWCGAVQRCLAQSTPASRRRGAGNRPRTGRSPNRRACFNASVTRSSADRRRVEAARTTRLQKGPQSSSAHRAAVSLHARPSRSVRCSRRNRPAVLSAARRRRPQTREHFENRTDRNRLGNNNSRRRSSNSRRRSSNSRRGSSRGRRGVAQTTADGAARTTANDETRTTA